MRRFITAAVLSVSIMSLGPYAAAEEPGGPWVAGEPDAMIAANEVAARRGGSDAIARLLVIEALADEATAGQARAALERLGRAGGPVAGEARWLARALAPDRLTSWEERTSQREDSATPLPGLVRTWTILGPFEDTGGGLDRSEGPEEEGHRFVGADYSWGVNAVRPTRTLVATVDARGVPLDLYVHPRPESCSYLSSVVTLPSEPVHLHVASTGSLRIMVDRKEVHRDDSVHEEAKLDRAVLQLEGSGGDHEVTLKVCSSARPDAGRVRARYTRVDGSDIAVATTSSLVAIDALRARPAPAVAVQRIASPLEGATDVAQVDGPTHPVDVLTAATVHHLAGADDLRSSKGPGLLDRLTGSPSVTADQLAMAGWLTSFGANKSGWLRQALERARAGGDPAGRAIADFAQRALVVARLGIGSLDLARDTAAAAPLAGADDAHATWLRAELLAAEGDIGLANKALEELEALAAATGNDTPMVVWRSLARLSSSGRPALHLGALEKLAEGRSGHHGPSYASAFAMLGATALERAVLGIALTQSSASDLGALGNQLLGSGRYVAAAEIFELASELSPNRAPLHIGLARARQRLEPTSPASEAGLVELTRAAELQPEANRLAAELRFRKGASGDEPQLGEDARHLVAPAVFLERKAKNPAPAEGLHSRQLHWRRVVRLHPDKRVSQVMHYAREIIIEPRTEADRYENLPRGYGTEVLIARVHRDGAELPPEQEDKGGMVRWPELERGDVVEVAVRNWTPGPVGRRGDPPFYFVDYVGAVDTEPVLYNEVVVDAPDGAAFAFDVIGGKADERKTERRDGRTITRLIWHRPPTVAQEPFAPRVTEIVPVVAGSIYPSWDAFLGWYRGAVEGFTTPDEQVKRLAEEITAGKHTREAKVQALFDFVADDIRYVNYVSGEWWLPNRPQQLLARRQGDCDDKAMLLISLLRAVGIEAHEVLVQTRHTAQRRVMQSTEVAIPMFDHGIIYLPDEDGEGGRYLDATSPKSRVGSLPSMDAGAMALLVGEGARPELTPLPPPHAHGLESTWTLKLDADGGGSLVAEEEHVGDDAFRLRTHLGEEDARAQWVEQNLVAGYFAGLSMDPDVGFRSDLPGGKAKVTYRATSRSLARREGKDLVVEISPPMPIASLLAPLPKRTLPVELPGAIAPHRQERVVRIIAPKGLSIATLPPNEIADGGAFGKAEVSYEQISDTEAIMKRSIGFASPRISVADYPAWRRWLQRVDGLLRRSIRLSPR